MPTQILVVDDESVTRRVVTLALKSIDIEAISAVDGQDAISLATQQPFAMAIVDINLPDIDGFEVTRQLKKIAHMREVPIIIFTARNNPSDEANAAEVGAVGFLYKPFSTQELRDLVKQHIVPS